MQRSLVIALALFVLVVPSSAAKVIPDACVDGVALWNTRAEVLSEKGLPLRKVRPNNLDIIWRYRDMTIYFAPYEPSDLLVVSVSSTNRTERTARGIGIGSSERAAKRAYPNLSCVTSNGTRLCALPGWVAGRFTELKITRSRVSEIRIYMDSGFDDGRRQKPNPRCRS